MESGYISFQDNRNLAWHGSTLKKMEKSFLFGRKEERSQYEKVKHTREIQILMLISFNSSPSFFASLFMPPHPLSCMPSHAEESRKIKALPPLFRPGSLKPTAGPDAVPAMAHVALGAGSTGLRDWRTRATGLLPWAQAMPHLPPSCGPTQARVPSPALRCNPNCCPKQLCWTSVNRTHTPNWTREKDTTVAEALG